MQKNATFAPTLIKQHFSCAGSVKQRGGRVVDCDGLENR